MHYALIDESGRMYDPTDKILVFAVLIAENLKERLSEIKFSISGDNTRAFVLKELAKKAIKVYVTVIDKDGRKIHDTPTNYALLVSEALSKPLTDLPRLTHIIIDRHFTYITQKEAFNLALQQRFGKERFIEHVDSLQNPVITLADFVAGVFRVAYSKHNLLFTDYIREKIVEERLVTWREIKSGKP